MYGEEKEKYITLLSRASRSNPGRMAKGKSFSS